MLCLCCRQKTPGDGKMIVRGAVGCLADRVLETPLGLGQISGFLTARIRTTADQNLLLNATLSGAWGLGREPYSLQKRPTLPAYAKDSASKTLLEAMSTCSGMSKSKRGGGVWITPSVAHRCSGEPEGLILRTRRARTELEEALWPKGQVRALDCALHRLHPTDGASAHAAEARGHRSLEG